MGSKLVLVPTVRFTMLEKPVTLKLSIATACNAYFPAGTLVHTTLYGLVTAVPTRLVPAKNWTFVRGPSGLEAEALIVRLVGIVIKAPLVGIVIEIVGGTSLLSTLLKSVAILVASSG